MFNNIRLRFAPSPTGFLHVGGLRTALYNYLFATKNNGKLVLRIEDTDQERIIPGSIENLISTLKVMGIHYHEGPDQGGAFAPYVQSKRVKIYRQHARSLIENGSAYYCFCSEERLSALREEQLKQNLQTKYDGKCRNLPSSVAKNKISARESYVIRLKMPKTGETTFNDLIRGTVSFQNELVDDQILVKSDGFPTYHLANVIDDHLMEISHVIRGEEWLQSMPKHIELYKAFGWEIPKYAHLPLLLNPDRSKLSKRQGDVAVEDYLTKGYVPEALINFVALLGWNPGTEKEFFNMEELINEFFLERVGKAGAVFNIEKLNWMNANYIRQMDSNKRYHYLARFLEKAGYDISDKEKTSKIIDSVYKKMEKGADVVHHAAIFYQDSIEITEEDAVIIMKKQSSKKVVKKLFEILESTDELTINSFKDCMKKVQDETGIKKQDLWMPVRVALTGVTHGPELPLVIEIFGKKKIEYILNKTLQMFDSK
jgi:glutamyl-tRNA synthetase